MLKHIVLFKLKSFPTSEEKYAQLIRIKEELEALPALIPAIEKMQVFLNENPNESFDFMLETEVESLEALLSYANHPEHIRVAVEHIKPYVEARACIDYTIQSK